MATKVAVFASGNGTNAERMFQYFQGHGEIEIALLLSNNASAGALKRAERWSIPSIVFDRSDLNQTGLVEQRLMTHQVDWIVLAGFLWLLPSTLVSAYSGRILNIHPSLLPDYGGKGMYGARVHEAVIRDGRQESGITIHLVDEEYDSGQIVFQARCPVAHDDTPDTLAARIHELEYENYPRVLEKLITEAKP